MKTKTRNTRIKFPFKAFPQIEIPSQKWLEIGALFFGDKAREWKFLCVACGHSQSIGNYMHKHPGANEKDVANWIMHECEGRHDKMVGCQWTCGGFIPAHRTSLLAKDPDSGRIESLAIFEFDHPDWEAKRLDFVTKK